MHPQMSNTYITHAEQYVPAEDTSRVVNQRGMIERVILVILAFDRDHGHLYSGFRRSCMREAKAEVLVTC